MTVEMTSAGKKKEKIGQARVINKPWQNHQDLKTARMAASCALELPSMSKFSKTDRKAWIVVSEAQEEGGTPWVLATLA